MRIYIYVGLYQAITASFQIIYFCQLYTQKCWKLDMQQHLCYFLYSMIQQILTYEDKPKFRNTPQLIKEVKLEYFYKQQIKSKKFISINIILGHRIIHSFPTKKTLGLSSLLKVTFNIKDVEGRRKTYKSSESSYLPFFALIKHCFIFKFYCVLKKWGEKTIVDKVLYQSPNNKEK